MRAHDPYDLSDLLDSGHDLSDLGGRPVEAQGGGSIYDQYKKMQAMMGNNRTPVDTGRDLLAGLIGGLGKGGQMIASAVNPNAPQVNFDELTSKIASPNKSMGGELAQGIGSYLPYGAAAGARLLPQLAAGGFHGASQSKPSEEHLMGLLPQGRTGGAIMGAGLNLIPSAIMKGLEKLRPSNLYRGNLSAEELARNVETARGTPTGLGDVIESPFLKRQYENVLTKLPLSGATQKMQQAGQAVVDRGTQILEKALGGNNPENVGEQVFDVLNKQYEIHKNAKNALYKNFNQEAEKQFLDLPMKNFESLARKHMAAIQDTNMLKYDPEATALLKKLNIYVNPVEKMEANLSQTNQFGDKLLGENLTTYKYPTAEEANLLKGKLNALSNQLRASPNADDRFKAGIFGNLAKAIKEDIMGAVEKSGNPKLKAAYESAEQNYAKNFSQFLDKDIYKYIGGKETDSDKIVSDFIKMSTTSDRAKRVTKLTSKLPETESKLIGYSYLSRALDNEGSLNPNKLATLINKLGKNQFKALFPDTAFRKELKNYTRLARMNTRATNMMFNPLTGQQNLDILPGLMAQMGTGMFGGKMGGIPGAIAGALAPGLAGRGAVKKLTDEVYREKLVNAMIENKKWNPKNIQYLQTLLQGSNE